MRKYAFEQIAETSYIYLIGSWLNIVFIDQAINLLTIQIEHANSANKA